MIISPTTSFTHLLRNIRAGLRVAAFQKVTRGNFSATGGQLAAMTVMELAASYGIRFLAAGPDAYLDPADIPGIIFHLPFILFAAHMGAIAAKDNITVMLAIGAVGAAIPLALFDNFLLLAIANGWLPPVDFFLSSPHYFPFFGWWSCATILGFLRFAAPPRRLPVVLFLSILLILPLWFFPRPTIWIGAPTGEETGTPPLEVTSEAVLYEQPHLLDRRLDALRPGRKGVPDLYFLGFAGYAEEDVFLNDIMLADELFRERFDTDGRAVTLINNRASLKDAPLATRTALRRTLAHIGGIMNREEDILFLYLSSHGTEDHELEVSFSPLQLDPIGPADLGRMLDDAGIIWRVIVVSACYSGGFIQPLQNQRTLMVTASDADHNSFGCGSESDFTFFGKAYFDQALRRESSFITAFDRAKDLIHRRELAAGETPSNPQISVGPSIRVRLAALQTRLARTGNVYPTTPSAVKDR